MHGGPKQVPRFTTAGAFLGGLAYALGFILILAIERGIVRRQTRTTARRGAPKEAAEK
jgi:hypothetical protein